MSPGSRRAVLTARVQKGAQRGTVGAPAHRGTSVPRPARPGAARSRSRHFRARMRRPGPSACAALGSSQLQPLGAHAPPPVPHPPPPQPAAAWYQRVAPPGVPCVPRAPGTAVVFSSHGDGASERAVRGASESGDGHDGPQLHPALPAGSPQGSWSPGAQGLPRDPYPRLPLRPFQTHLSPASAALGPPTPRGDSGFWSCGPPHLFPLGSSLACAPVFALNSRVANCRAFSSHFSVAFLPTPHVFSL